MKIRIIIISLLMWWQVNGNTLLAQSILSRTVSIQTDKQRLDAVLEILSNKGGFQFSYKSDIIKRDSLVTINATNKTVKQVLDNLFGDRLEYIESGNYIILRYRPIQINTQLKQQKTEDKKYLIYGRVVDYHTGASLPNVSIYEKDQLVSTLTNNQGYFKLKLKSTYRSASLSVSKDNYVDTTLSLKPKFNQELLIPIMQDESAESPFKLSYKDTLPGTIKVVSDSFKIEKTRLGNFLLSTRAKTQNRNIRNFFTCRSFQVSFTPGLSTYGFLNSKVTNKYSFNIIGGYSGGVSQFELGGVFNVVNKNVQYAQIAGVFNLVGGSVRGLQLAGTANYVGGNVKGWQVAGAYNYTKGIFDGLQMAGAINLAEKKFRGVQLAGSINIAVDSLKGAQIAGAVNLSRGYLEGVQISGAFNLAEKIKGVQIGLVNIADSVDGWSIGLLSIVKKGYHKVGISSNEIVPLNLELKTGTHRFYNIFSAGWRPMKDSRIYSAGYGIGNESKVNNDLSLNTELSSHFLYLGSFDYQNTLTRLSLSMKVDISKSFSIYAGPSFSVYYSNQPAKIGSYAFDLTSKGLGNFTWSSRTKAWFGFNAGILLF